MQKSLRGEIAVGRRRRSSVPGSVKKDTQMERKEETGCQTPEGPILCINNCGFFGSAATAYMCSKCHKDMLLKQHASSSIETLINGSSNASAIVTEKHGAESVVVLPSASEPKTTAIDTLLPGTVDSTTTEGSSTDAPSSASALLPKEGGGGTKRCFTCRKRVGLTGFSCRCGNMFCGAHRYSDKHECPFDYRRAGQEAIARANPVVKADKLDKI